MLTAKYTHFVKKPNNGIVEATVKSGNNKLNATCACPPPPLFSHTHSYPYTHWILARFCVVVAKRMHILVRSFGGTISEQDKGQHTP